MGEALPSHQADVVWSGNLVCLEWFCVQLAKVFLLKSFIKTSSYGRPKGSRFLCQFGVEHLELEGYVSIEMMWALAIVGWNSWLMQNWSGKGFPVQLQP